jgi:hypothetical protein
MASHTLSCTFCKRSEHEVTKLVAGPGVYICDACIDIAYRIVHESGPAHPDPRSATSLVRRVTAWVGSLGRRQHLSAEAPGIYSCP